MNPLWREFLAARGARPDTSGLVDFPSHAAHSAAAWLADLSHLAVVEVAGADAGAFLHGQFSSDVAGLAADRGQLGAWCSARGRVIVVLIVMRLAGRYLLVLPRGQCEAFVRRLRMYVLRADVSVAERDGSAVIFGLVAGPAQSPSGTAALPAGPCWGIAETAGCAQLRLPGAADARRWLIIGELEAARARWDGLAAHAVPAARSCWQLQDILAGIPWLHAGLSGEFLPQELGLESLGGLSLSKGCYPGQEVIARVHFRGRAKRGLFHFSAESDTPPAPGTALRLGDAAPRTVGAVLDARSAGDSTYAGLAVCEFDATSAARPRLATADGTPIVLGELIK